MLMLAFSSENQTFTEWAVATAKHPDVVFTSISWGLTTISSSRVFISVPCLVFSIFLSLHFSILDICKIVIPLITLPHSYILTWRESMILYAEWFCNNLSWLATLYRTRRRKGEGKGTVYCWVVKEAYAFESEFYVAGWGSSQASCDWHIISERPCTMY